MKKLIGIFGIYGSLIILTAGITFLFLKTGKRTEQSRTQVITSDAQ